MIQIKPIKEELENAQKFAKIYDEGGYGKNVLGVSHSEFIDFIRIGKLCELVFVRLLKEKGISCECKEILVPCKDEHRNGSDLTLRLGQGVDVKAANKPFHVNLLVREDQFKAQVHDLYVASKYINDEMIEFHGYATGEELKKIKPKDFGHGLCRHKLLRDLKPIEEFIKYCKADKKVE